MHLIDRRPAFRTLVAAAWLCVLASPALAQTGAAAPASASASGSGVGVAIQAGTLGVGGDVAVRVSRSANIRGGFDTFSFTRDFDDDGTVYTGKLKVQSFHAFVDWFPFKGAFHLSPGLVFGNDTSASLSSTVSAGTSTEIGDVRYYSNPANPIRIAGAVTAKQTGFALTMGWGNLASGRKFKVPFEVGVVFTGAPEGALTFTGSGCAANGTNCRDVATDATIQAEVRKQNTKLNDALNKPYAKYWPVITLGLGFRF